MKHLKKIKSDASTVPCCWANCTTEWRDEVSLNTHIAVHLESFEQNGESYKCCWGECYFQTIDFKEFQRHAYYHGYYTNLLMKGKNECSHNGAIPKCKSLHKKKCPIPDIKSDFLCEWLDCKCTFISIVEFQDHIVQHASFEYEIQKTPTVTKPKVRCNWSSCRKQLDNRYRLIEHIGTHSNKKIVACDQCGEVFRTRTTLFDHLRRQQDNTHKFQCIQCFKFFATEKLLRSHFLKHVNRYKCNMCNMSCSSASSLATHIRYRHLKDKPFKCTECDHRCVRKCDLDKHQQHVHSKKIHRCSHSGCNYAVRTYNLLRRHYLEIHSNSPFIYICHCCNKLFKHSKSLSAHLIKKHGYKLPSGHKRFIYRIDENEFYRLETMRIESLEVTKQILSPHPQELSETPRSSCNNFESITDEQDKGITVLSNAIQTQFTSEVVISMPMEDDF